MQVGSNHILVRNSLVRWSFLFAFGVTLAIFYWLIDMRSEALDITFEHIFRGLFLFHDYPLALAALIVLPLALVPTMRSYASVLTQFVGRNIHAVAATYFVVLALAAFFVYHAYPLSMDEYAAVFQSKIFAAFQLTGHFPPDLIDWLIPKGFQNYFVAVSHEDGRVVSSYWPGFALLMTPFTALGVPWLCNPVLGAASVFVIYRLTERIFGDAGAAGLAALLAMAAPAFAVNAISFYSMAAHLLLNGAFVLLLLQPSAGRAFAAGAVGSLALCLHNPVPHALFAAPWLVRAVLSADRKRILPALIAGYLPLSVVLGLGWPLLLKDISTVATSDPVQGGALVTMQLSEVFAVPLPWLLYARAIGLAKVWLWAAPLSVAVALCGFWRWRDTDAVRTLAWSAAITFVGYLFVPFDQGHGWGFRYFHSAWFVIPIFAAAATIGRTRSGQDETTLREFAGFVSAGGALSLIVLLPVSAVQVDEFITRHRAQDPTTETARVTILRPDAGYYAYDLVQNDPFLRGTIRMLSRRRENDEQMMAKHFPHLRAVQRGLQGSVWEAAPTDSGSSGNGSDSKAR